jgi:hypothetical protein
MFTNNAFYIIKKILEEKKHILFTSGRAKLDVNKDNKINAADFKLLRNRAKRKRKGNK